MGYKKDFSSGAVDFIIPPPPGITTTPLAPTVPSAPVKAPIEPGTVHHQVRDYVEQQAYQEIFDVKVFRCTCQRCPKVWITMQQTKPKTCPNCKSPWWDRRPSQKMGPVYTARGNKKKKGKGKFGMRRLKPGWTGRGRPPKDAYEDVETEGTFGGNVVLPEEVPEIPVALLGALGEPAVTFDQGDSGTAAADEEDFPVPTPFDTPAPGSATVEPVADPPFPARQSINVGGSPNPPSEVLPPSALDPDLDGPPVMIDDDDWDRFGE